MARGGFQKVKKLGNKDLGLEETQRRGGIIKQNLAETKNVSPGQLSAAEIRGGFRANLEEQERLKEIKRIELEQALLNATPASQAQTTQALPVQPQGSQAAQSQLAQEVQTQPNGQPSLQNGQNQPLKTIASDEGQGFLPELREGINELGGVPGIGQLPPQKGLGETGQALLGVTAKVIDAVRTSFSGKSSKQLIASEEVMNTYMGALTQDVSLVQQGLKSFEEVNFNLKQAEIAINSYEMNLKSEGKRNLNFWIDEGARIEANVALQRERLADTKRQLINAELARRGF